jgi:hypothetical protein
MPPEVSNLMFVAHIKLKAGRAGVKSLVTEDGKIVIRLFEGLQLDRQKTLQLPEMGIAMGRTQLSIEYKRYGKDWDKALERIIDTIK